MQPPSPPATFAELGERVEPAVFVPPFSLTPSDGGASGDLRIKTLEDELQSAREEIARLGQLVEIDQLTGLLNDRGVRRCLDLEVARARRYERDLAVLLIDLHRPGATDDAVLRTIAERIRESLRATDVLGRGRNDEFFVMCTETDAAGAVKVAEKLVGGATRPAVDVDGAAAPSPICVAIVPVSPGMTSADVLHSARVALERARRAGGNRWSL